MDERENTILTIFAAMAASHTPVRMDRKAAMMYVNRRSDTLFDQFLEKHEIKESTYGKNGKREYYTYDLATATKQEYAHLYKND